MYIFQKKAGKTLLPVNTAKLNIRIILLSKVIIKCMKQQLDTLENTDSRENMRSSDPGGKARTPC